MLPWLESETPFPPAESALNDPNGLLAAGGDLSVERLCDAYRRGIFPWYEDGQPILWWSPSPRTILLPRDIHVSKSTNKAIRKQQPIITTDTVFEKVIQQCAEITRRHQEGTWITAQMQKAYIDLHHRGFAHSVEVWFNGQLAGGLYGVAIGRAFFGESMFSNQSNASKFAAIALCQQLKLWGFGFIDCQVHTQHLASLGATTVSRKQFSNLLDRYTSQDSIGQWQHNWSVRCL
jgi:leucyl/phenylalanyl-tRNA--protein transferase